jgi:hypothetical protein
MEFKESVTELARNITDLPIDSVASANHHLTCPTCQATITDIFRYSRFSQLSNLYRVVDRMHAKFGRKLLQRQTTIGEVETQLRGTFSNHCAKIIPNVMASKKNQQYLRERGSVFDVITADLQSLKGKLSLVPSYSICAC